METIFNPNRKLRRQREQEVCTQASLCTSDMARGTKAASLVVQGYRDSRDVTAFQCRMEGTGKKGAKDSPGLIFLADSQSL